MDRYSHLFLLVALMVQIFHVFTLKNLHESDYGGRGLTEYSVKKGDAQQLSQYSLPHKALISRKIWNSNSLPWINIFCWTLSYDNILSSENMERRESRVSPSVLFSFLVQNLRMLIFGFPFDYGSLVSGGK